MKNENPDVIKILTGEISGKVAEDALASLFAVLEMNQHMSNMSVMMFKAAICTIIEKYAVDHGLSITGLADGICDTIHKVNENKEDG